MLPYLLCIALKDVATIIHKYLYVCRAGWRCEETSAKKEGVLHLHMMEKHALEWQRCLSYGMDEGVNKLIN